MAHFHIHLILHYGFYLKSRKNHNYSIIIDKFSRKCFVYIGGTRRYAFDAELGINWVGDKRESGDNATPEGMYKVTKKFEGNKTRYHKALLLDYPNDEDRKKFKSEIAGGSLKNMAIIINDISLSGYYGYGMRYGYSMGYGYTYGYNYYGSGYYKRYGYSDKSKEYYTEELVNGGKIKGKNEKA